MARSVKIHKKKSFMFTSKHHSFVGWLGTVIAIIAMAVMSTMILYSYHNGGNVEVKFGAIGLFTAILNLIGIVCGIYGLQERDIFKSTPIIAIVANGLMILEWIISILIA